MNVTICQYDVHWNSPIANFGTVEELCSGLDTNLIILPEMFSSGFTTNTAKLTDPLAIKTKQWMKSFSQNKLIIGSSPNKLGDEFYNTLFAVENGIIREEYHKRHVYLGTESENFTKGKKLGTINYKDWKIGLNVCYDLRFPVWSRAQEADVLIYCANWPSARKEHWYALLKARAIENQCYVIGVNRIGTDQNEWYYEGDSIVFDFWGNEILNLRNEENALSVNLDKAALEEYREKLPFLGDRDKFELHV